MTRRVAAFDFDGTITERDSLFPFCHRVAGWSGTATLLPRLGVTLLGNRAKRRDRAKAVLLSQVFAGRLMGEVAGLGTDYARELPQRYRPRAIEAIDGHRRRGDELVLVSASLAVYARPAAMALGFDEVIAVELEVDGGVCTGAMVGPNVRGPEKARRLRAHLGDEPVELWAYGDSSGDRELLELADHPTWF